MTDDDFLARLADATLAPAEFDHAGHVRAAYLVLRREPTFGAALDRIAGLIRHFATRHGQSDKYHETITVAFMALVNARLQGRPPVPDDAAGWPAFAAANPDLMVACPH